MMTDCMRSTLESEHQMMTQETKTYQGVLESLVGRKSVMKTDEANDEALCPENQLQLKKPRRKDTPIFNSPPHIPGVRLLKTEKQIVHLEDEEKDVNN